MVRFTEECLTVYRLARLDVGVRDENVVNRFPDVSGAFTRVQVYMENHKDEMDSDEYTELYLETMLLKAIAIAEDGVCDFDSAEKLLRYAKTCDDAEMREILAIDGIPCENEMLTGEFLAYRNARKKRWKNGYKLTKEIFYQKLPEREPKSKPCAYILR